MNRAGTRLDDWGPSSSRTRSERRCLYRAGIKGSSGGRRAKPKRVANAIKHVQAELFVEDSPSRAKDGLAVSEDIPRQADSWPEVVVVAIEWTCYPVPNLHDACW